MRKVLRLLTIILVSTVIMSFILKLDFVKNNHFNLITVNAVFVGFLFTSLSMLLGFLNEKIIQFFESAGALKDVYTNIEFGIVCSLASITVSIINLTIVEKYIKNTIIINMMYCLEINLLIITLIFLFITIKNLKIVIESIKFSKSKEKESQLADNQLDDLLNNK